MNDRLNQGNRQSEAGNGSCQREPQFRFLEGWFTQSFEAGNEPRYGYPKNHLPEPAVDSMEVETVFFSKPKA